MKKLFNNLWVKWSVLVFFNAILGLYFSLMGGDWLYKLGVIIGVCAFIPCYVSIHNYAIQSNHKILERSLLVAVGIRIISQGVFVVDMFAGLIAITTMDATAVNYQDGFLGGFVLTLLTGGILSLLVVIMTLFFMAIFWAYENFKKSSNH